MYRLRKTFRAKQSTLSKKIVGLTVFLDALFLVVVIAALAFFYFKNIQNQRIQNAALESEKASLAIETFLTNTFSDLTNLSEDQDVINYLNYLKTTTSPVILDTEDPDYLIYHNFEMRIESMREYSIDSIYNFIFVASESECSTGLDGCYVGTSDEVSPIAWNLSERPWISDLGQKEETLTNPYMDSLSGEPVITFVKKVYDGTDLIGYIGIDVLVENIGKAIYSFDYYQDDSEKSLVVFISNLADPQIIYFSNPDYQDYSLLHFSEISNQDAVYGLDAGMELLVESKVGGEVVELNAFGSKGLLSTTELSDIGWEVSTFVYRSVQIGLELTFLILLGSILGLMVLISLILSHKINKTLNPINDILDSIEEIKNGNYDVSVNIKDNTELKYVADALNIMSKEIGKQVNLVYQNYVFDQLTGLKIRRAVHQEIEEHILAKSIKSAICLLDIENMKNINVTKGQNVADDLLKLVGERLSQTLRFKEGVYFNNGSEFVFIVPEIKQLDAVESEVQRVMEGFREPIIVQDLKVEIKIHVGIAIFPSDGKNMTELMKKCNTALYKAKQSSNARFVFYNDRLTREVNYGAQVNDELSYALERNQLYLKYQPLIDKKSDIYGFEALIRWSSPTLGEISPQIFISNAEESHLIIPIGTWILRKACQTQVTLSKKFGIDFVMSVNVSPIQLIQKDFLDNLKKIIKETDINPKCLALEITEGVLIESTLYLDETIDFLHSIGAKISLDDFGTGYASLTYLRKIPFDNLKIDKSFVDGIFASKKDHSIIGTIVDLVHNLDMKIIAEGVETRKQYEFLRQIQTDVFQGFLFSKALTFDEVILYIDQFYKVARNKRLDVFAASDYED